MKIIFSNNNLYGLIYFRGDIINHFLEKGYQIVMVYPKSTRSDILVNKIPKQCNVYEVEMNPNGNNPINDFIYLKQLYKIFKQEKPDVVFNFTIKPNIYGTFAAKLIKVKVVDMVPGLGYVFIGNGFKSMIARFLYKIALRLSDRVIVLNSYNFNLLLERKFVKKNNLVLFEGGEGVNLKYYNYER